MRIVVAFVITTLASIAIAQDIDNGEKIYHDYLCYACHGFNGTGHERPLANDLSGIMVNESVFITFLRQRADQQQMVASRAMPYYDAGSLTDAQARDLYAYIKTFKDEPPVVKDDALMQQIIDLAKAEAPPDK